jgi:hypothetical protein
VGPRVIREELGGLIAPASLPSGDRALFKPAAPKIARRREPARKTGQGPAAETAPAARKTYQPGWAKPKPRMKSHAPRKPRS